MYSPCFSKHCTKWQRESNSQKPGTYLQYKWIALYFFIFTTTLFQKRVKRTQSIRYIRVYITQNIFIVPLLYLSIVKTLSTATTRKSLYTLNSILLWYLFILFSAFFFWKLKITLNFRLFQHQVYESYLFRWN